MLKENQFIRSYLIRKQPGPVLPSFALKHFTMNSGEVFFSDFLCLIFGLMCTCSMSLNHFCAGIDRNVPSHSSDYSLLQRAKAYLEKGSFWPLEAKIQKIFYTLLISVKKCRVGVGQRPPTGWIGREVQSLKAFSIRIALPKRGLKSCQCTVLLFRGRRNP